MLNLMYKHFYCGSDFRKGEVKMISENEVRQMYEKALDRVVGYHGMAS